MLLLVLPHGRPVGVEAAVQLNLNPGERITVTKNGRPVAILSPVGDQGVAPYPTDPKPGSFRLWPEDL